MNYHGNSFFDHVLLNGTIVFDHGSSWSTMVDHGQFCLSRKGLDISMLISDAANPGEM